MMGSRPSTTSSRRRSATGRPGSTSAVGTCRCSARSRRKGRIWLSADGSSWEDVTPTGTFGDSSVYQLVVLPDGAVVAFAEVSVLAEGEFGTV